MMVVQARRHQKIQNENEPNNYQEQTKNISIDPKTWVKLGHFHLLLEEYRKGVIHIVKTVNIPIDINNLKILLQHYPLIKCSIKLKLKIIGWILRSFMAWD